jgi:hypothetical protein
MAVLGALAAVLLSACSSESAPPSRSAAPDPSSTPHRQQALCQPFPDRLIDDFIAAYNGRDLEGLQTMSGGKPIEDMVAAAYSGTSVFANITQWAKAGWDAKDRMNLVGYSHHPTKRGFFQMNVTRRSSVLRGHGIVAVSTTFDAVSAGCSITSLEVSGIVQARREPCAFYEEFAAIRDVAANEPGGCFEGSSDHARTNHAAVWTGDRALMWGGDRGGLFEFGDAIRGGLSLDPRSRRWQRIPELELPTFTPQVSAWTGREMIVLGSKTRGIGVVAAAYSPIRRAWRTIDFPYRGWAGFEGVWTGSRLMLWGGGQNHSSRFSRRGAVYDPATDAWRNTSPAPIKGRDSHAAAWTGSEVIVWGGSNADSDLADGAAYNPSTDTWRQIAPAPLSPRQWFPGVWTGREVIVWGGSSFSRNRADGAAYDPIADSWRMIGRAPIEPRCCHTALWTGDSMFVFGGTDELGHMALGDGAIYQPGADRWLTQQLVPEFNVPDCGVVDPVSDTYGAEIEPHLGRPGEIVTLFGTTVRGEDGRWTDSNRLEAWWNTKAPGGPPVKDGPVVKLVEVGDMRRCYFRAKFKVPDVAPGTYRISIFVWDVPPSEGYGLFLPMRFTVTPSER